MMGGRNNTNPAMGDHRRLQSRMKQKQIPPTVMLTSIAKQS